jgi:hypothetical protein
MNHDALACKIFHLVRNARRHKNDISRLYVDRFFTDPKVSAPLQAIGKRRMGATFYVIDPVLV